MLTQQLSDKLRAARAEMVMEVVVVVVVVVERVCFWRDIPQVDPALLIHKIARSHTTTHHSR